jgi:hypothetical protein
MHCLLLQDIIATASAVGGDRGAIVEPFISELNRFLSADVNENETAMDFWRQKSTDFPILSQMAKIYLAISPGSVPVESMFSTAGYMLNSRRSSMAPYKADMVLFLHDNYDVVS